MGKVLTNGGALDEDKNADSEDWHSSIYDPGAVLTCPETRAVFLADALATGNVAHFVAAVGIAVSAFRLAEMDRLTGIAVADLEQLFGIHGDPDLDRLMKVLRVLGLSLSVAPMLLVVQGAEQA